MGHRVVYATITGFLSISLWPYIGTPTIAADPHKISSDQSEQQELDGANWKPLTTVESVNLRYDERRAPVASLSHINLYDDHTMCRNLGKMHNIVPVYLQHDGEDDVPLLAVLSAIRQLRW